MKNKYSPYSIFARILTAVFILTILIPTFAFAQRRNTTRRPAKQTVSKTTGEQPTGKCSGWVGKVTYLEKKHIDNSKSKGKYGYERYTFDSKLSGEVVLSGNDRAKSSATLQSKEVMEDENRAEDCCWINLKGCARETVAVRKNQSTTIINANGNATSGGRVYIEGGHYSLDLMLPALEGTMDLKIQGSRSGFCDDVNNGQQNNETSNPDLQYRATPIVVSGTLDPSNPDTISGSYQPNPDTMITWGLTRATGDCDDGDLTLNSLELAHQVFPNPTKWETIGDGTIDGNEIRIKATVSNSSTKSKSGTVVIKEETTGETIGSKSVSVPAGGDAEIELKWDTTGYSWTDDKKKAPQRKIVATLKSESLEQEVWIRPKPVILVHGLWSNAAAWSEYQSYLNEAHSFAWKGYAVGADPANGKMNTGDHAGNTAPTNSIFQNAGELGKQIKFVQENDNAWHVDIVAHSMGGLISRFYIHHMMKMAPDGKPTVGRLVMFGTPNQGSPWADIVFKEFKDNGYHVEALRELQTDVCRTFNSQVTNRKNVKFSIVYTDKVPFTGDSSENGDGVVSVSSAIWQIADRSLSDSWEHTALTGRSDFIRFVYPRLAAGPKAAKSAMNFTPGERNETFALNRISDNWLASLDPAEFLSAVQAAPKRSVKIQPGQSVEIDVPATAATRGGIALLAPPLVSATLINAAGEILAEDSAGSSETAFRYLIVETPVAAGTWKLKLENTGDAEELVIFAPVFDTNPLVFEFTEIRIQQDGAVALQAKLTNSGSPVTGAKVTVTVSGSNVVTILLDDGKHGDAAANDGIYGGTTEKLPPTDYIIEAKAAANAATRTATMPLSVGGF